MLFTTIPLPDRHHLLLIHLHRLELEREGRGCTWFSFQRTFIIVLFMFLEYFCSVPKLKERTCFFIVHFSTVSL